MVNATPGRPHNDGRVTVCVDPPIGGAPFSAPLTGRLRSAETKAPTRASFMLSIDTPPAADNVARRRPPADTTEVP